MNKFEDISVLMDGESGPRYESVLATVYGDSELRDAWRRYHLVGDAMRSQLPEQMPAADLASRISSALEDEPAILSPQRRTRSFTQRLMKPAAGVAIAASVALVAIVGLRGMDQTTTATNINADTVAESKPAADTTDNPPVIKPGPDRDTPVQSLQPAGPSPLARTVSTDGGAVQGGYQQPDNQYRFNSYLINHNEYRANSGVRGSMPYARIVAPYGNSQ